MTWDEYNRACEGFHYRQELEWERTRYISHLIYNANSKTAKTPEELVPLRLDAERKKYTPKIDVTRLRERMRIEQERLNQKNGK